MRNDEKFKALQELKAGELAHLNGSLMDHLVGTAKLLTSWAARDELVDAGLFHAAYGTAAFDQTMISVKHRHKVAVIVGASSEQIIYNYCACDRNFVWPQFGLADKVIFRDRFTESNINIDEQGLRDFCELTVANEIEIAHKDESFIEQYSSELKELFGCMSPYLTKEAIGAYSKLLSRGVV